MQQNADLMSLLTNLAQILSAIFTAVAVGVSLYLARRSDAQRLRLFIGLDVRITVGPVARTRSEALAHAVRFTAVNAGVLPVTVRHASLHINVKESDAWTFALNTHQPLGQNRTFPVVLQHGEEVGFVIPLDQLVRAWVRRPAYLWMIRRPRFSVFTSLAVVHDRRVPFKLLREINELCAELRQTPAFIEAAEKEARMNAAVHDELRKQYPKANIPVNEHSKVG